MRVALTNAVETVAITVATAVTRAQQVGFHHTPVIKMAALILATGPQGVREKIDSGIRTLESAMQTVVTTRAASRETGTIREEIITLVTAQAPTIGSILLLGALVEAESTSLGMIRTATGAGVAVGVHTILTTTDSIGEISILATHSIEMLLSTTTIIARGMKEVLTNPRREIRAVINT